MRSSSRMALSRRSRASSICGKTSGDTSWSSAGARCRWISSSDPKPRRCSTWSRESGNASRAARSDKDSHTSVSTGVTPPPVCEALPLETRVGSSENPGNGFDPARGFHPGPRNDETKVRSLAFLGFHPHLPAMTFHDRFHNRQTEPGAFRRVRAAYFDLIKLFENMFLLVLRNPRPGVLDGNHDEVAFVHRRNRDPALRCKLERVREQVVKDLGETVRVGHEQRQMLREMSGQLQVLRFKLRGEIDA